MPLFSENEQLEKWFHFIFLNQQPNREVQVSSAQDEKLKEVIHRISEERRASERDAEYHLQQVYTDRNYLIQLGARFARQLGYRVSCLPVPPVDGDERRWVSLTIELPTGAISFTLPSNDLFLFNTPAAGPATIGDQEAWFNPTKRQRIKRYVRPDLRHEY